MPNESLFDEQTTDERNSDRRKHVMMNMRQYLGSDPNACEVVESIQKRAQTASDMPGNNRRIRYRQIIDKNTTNRIESPAGKFEGKFALV